MYFVKDFVVPLTDRQRSIHAHVWLTVKPTKKKELVALLALLGELTWLNERRYARGFVGYTFNGARVLRVVEGRQNTMQVYAPFIREQFKGLRNGHK